MKIPSLVALTCLEVTELVTAYMEEALEPEDRAQLEQHLYACTWCMTYLTQLRRSIEWAQQLTAAEAEPSPEARAALSQLFRRWKGGAP